MELTNMLVVAAQPLIIHTPDMLQLCHKSQKPPPPISGGRFGDHIFFTAVARPCPWENNMEKNGAPYLPVPLRGVIDSRLNSLCHSFRF
jgi:hypothetical protein